MFDALRQLVAKLAGSWKEPAPVRIELPPFRTDADQMDESPTEFDVLPSDLAAVTSEDLVTVPAPADAPVAGLAPGSVEAQERQRQTVAKLRRPLEVNSAKTGIAFRLVPAGVFRMGSTLNEVERDSDEPQHRVTLTMAFYCGKYPVTQGQWAAVMGSNPANFKAAGDNAPVDSVSWIECQEFIRQLNVREGVPAGIYRLLSESQWEYACRAGTTTPFCFGAGLAATQANYDGTYPCGGAPRGENRKTTTPVGQFAPNAWGLYDMHGNVWEWCQDWYRSYPTESVTDPLGPEKGRYRVNRGGGWASHARKCRSASRFGYAPDYSFPYLGLRVCRLLTGR